MSRTCKICGKGPMAGIKYKRRGMIRRKGGAGSKIIGKTLRTFQPNLQPVRAVVEGRTQKITACAKCIKAGKVVKA
ncbi:MAG: 50S ribosomal protein L28 [Candidatus Omnitrophota bacterium]